MNRKMGDGTDLAAHLRQAGIEPEEVLERTEELPDELAYLWQAFLELDLARPAGFGVGAIPYGEIQAWALLTGVELSLWEVKVLRQLDLAYLNDHAENERKKRKEK